MVWYILKSLHPPCNRQLGGWGQWIVGGWSTSVGLVFFLCTSDKGAFCPTTINFHVFTDFARILTNQMFRHIAVTIRWKIMPGPSPTLPTSQSSLPLVRSLTNFLLCPHINSIIFNSQWNFGRNKQMCPHSVISCSIWDFSFLKSSSAASIFAKPLLEKSCWSTFSTFKGSFPWTSLLVDGDALSSI